MKIARSHTLDPHPAPEIKICCVAEVASFLIEEAIREVCFSNPDWVDYYSKREWNFPYVVAAVARKISFSA